jgi:hypothetical protein
MITESKFLQLESLQELMKVQDEETWERQQGGHAAFSVCYDRARGFSSIPNFPAGVF